MKTRIKRLFPSLLFITINWEITFAYSFNVAGNKNARILSPGSAFVSTDPWANLA